MVLKGVRNPKTRKGGVTLTPALVQCLADGQIQELQPIQLRLALRDRRGTGSRVRGSAAQALGPRQRLRRDLPETDPEVSY